MPSHAVRPARRALVSARSMLRLGAAGAAVALPLTATGCTLLTEPFTHVKLQHYDARSDAPTHGDLAFTLPTIIPTDATDITVRVETDNGSNKMYDWTSVSGALPSSCRPVTEDSAKPFDPDAWPSGVLQSNVVRCERFEVRLMNGRFYGWL